MNTCGVVSHCRIYPLERYLYFVADGVVVGVPELDVAATVVFVFIGVQLAVREPDAVNVYGLLEHVSDEVVHIYPQKTHKHVCAVPGGIEWIGIIRCETELFNAGDCVAPLYSLAPTVTHSVRADALCPRRLSASRLRGRRHHDRAESCARFLLMDILRLVVVVTAGSQYRALQKTDSVISCPGVVAVSTATAAEDTVVSTTAGGMTVWILV